MEFETADDLKIAVDKLDGTEFKGANVRCISDVCRLSVLKCLIQVLTVYSLRIRFLTSAAAAAIEAHARALRPAVGTTMAILLRTVDITADVVMGHLLVATAPVEMNTVVEPRHRETITTHATDTAPRLLLEVALVVLLWMIHTLLLVAAIPRTAMGRHRLVAAMKNHTPTGMIDVLDRPQEATVGVTMSVRATSDCSLGLATSGLIAYHGRHLQPVPLIPTTYPQGFLW